MSTDIAEAARVARTYGYFVTQGIDGAVFIQRKRDGDSIALVCKGGNITPYVDDYDAQDHLVASALVAARVL